MTPDLNLTPEQAAIFFSIMIPLVIYLATHLGTFRLDIEPKKKSEGKDTRRLTNPNYGAYIQLAGRRYN